MPLASRRTRLLVAAAVAALGIVASASAETDTVLLCHGTASDNNAYVLVAVDDDALAGHLDGSAPGHGWQNAPDFVLSAGQADCSVGGGEE
jgi:hypothetical protein